MPKKRFSAEQIVTLLRQIEVSIAQGKSAPVSCAANLSSWHFASVQTLILTIAIGGIADIGRRWR